MLSLGFGTIYVDEAAFSPQNISTYTWQKRGETVKLIRPTERGINVIAAWICKRKFAFMLKKGRTTSDHIIRFFELLDERLKALFG